MGLCTALYTGWEVLCAGLEAGWGPGLCAALYTGWEALCTALYTGWEGLCAALYTGWEGLCAGLEAGWGPGLSTALYTGWEGLYTGWGPGLCTVLYTGREALCTALYTGWEGLYTGWEALCTALYTGWEGLYTGREGLCTALYTGWEGLYTGWEALCTALHTGWEALCAALGPEAGWGPGRCAALGLCAALYAGLKLGAERLRRWRAGTRALVVGAGPAGLAAALVAVRSGKVLKLTVLDERGRAALLGRAQQVALEPRSLRFLRGLGVDFDNLEGCWAGERFFTRLGVFQEHLLSLLERQGRRREIRVLLGTKFSDDFIRKNLAFDWPKIIVVADGSCGESSSILGISPEYIVESCNAYGANAAIERPDQRQVPTPEIRARNLYFDLSAYGLDMSSMDEESLRPGFHLKIYGTFRNRYMALACPASDSKVVRFLRHTLNSSIMKNIFHQSFNAYKMDIEPRVNELTLHHVQCSRRLFEIMLSHRRVTAAFMEEENVVVTVEGEAARVLNFETGCGVNLGLRGLESLEEFIYRVATAVDQNDIFEALAAKIQHSKQVSEDFKQNGLFAAVFE